MSENTVEIEQEEKPSRLKQAVPVVIGSVAGIVATTATGYFLKSYKPIMDTKAQTLLLNAGISLISGTVGTVVASDISGQVEGTIDTIEAFRQELEERKKAEKKNKEVEIG